MFFHLKGFLFCFFLNFFRAKSLFDAAALVMCPNKINVLKRSDDWVVVSWWKVCLTSRMWGWRYESSHSQFIPFNLNNWLIFKNTVNEVANDHITAVIKYYEIGFYRLLKTPHTNNYTLFFMMSWDSRWHDLVFNQPLSLACNPFFCESRSVNRFSPTASLTHEWWSSLVVRVKKKCEICVPASSKGIIQGDFKNHRQS